jgi:hypothetical protein
MALTAEPTMSLTLSLMDRDKNVSTLGFYIVNGGLLAVIETAITDVLIPAVQAVTDAVVVAWTLTTGARDYAPTLPPESSDVERKGVFSFRAANGASYVVSVPSFKNTLVIDETNVIDKTAGVVSDFIGVVLDGTILGIAHPVTYLGSDIVSLTKAVKKHRGSGVG